MNDIVQKVEAFKDRGMSVVNACAKAKVSPSYYYNLKKSRKVKKGKRRSKVKVETIAVKPISNNRLVALVGDTSAVLEALRQL